MLRHVRGVLTYRPSIDTGVQYRRLQAIAISRWLCSRLDYCNSILYGLPATTFDVPQRAQNKLARVTPLCLPGLITSCVIISSCTEATLITLPFALMHMHDTVLSHLLTLWSPVSSYGYTSNIQRHRGLTYHFQFLISWHSGAEDWEPECLNVRN